MFGVIVVQVEEFNAARSRPTGSVRAARMGMREGDEEAKKGRREPGVTGGSYGRYSTSW